MLNIQEDKRSMYITVKDVCNKNKSIWSSLIAFVEAFGEFDTIISDIETQRLIQEGQTTGISVDKHKISEQLILSTFEISSAVYAYASKIGNNELMTKVNYSISKLSKSRDTILKDICQLVHDEADKIITELADYGKTPSDIEKQQKLLDDFLAIISNPRIAIATRKTATIKLRELFKKGDAILKNRLDKLMEKFQQTNSKLYKDYSSARIIISSGSQTTALTVLISDNAGNPVPKASAIIINIKIQKTKDIINEISKKSGTKGTFRIVNLVEGSYKMTIRKIGFVEKSLNFTVVNGETTKLNITLESISSPEIQ